MTRFVLLCCAILLAPQLIFANGTHPASFQPPVVTVQTLNHVSCAGGSNGSITLSVQQGQAPYTYTWSNGTTTPGQSNLTAGLYSVTVTDANLEQVILNNIEINQPAPVAIGILSVQQIDCLHAFGGITVLASGGTPVYQYQWNNGQNGPSATGLTVGTFTVTCTDINGCIGTAGATIQQNTSVPLADAGPPTTMYCSNSTQQLNGSGSAGAGYTYLWTAQNGGSILAGATTLQPTVNHTGTYLLTVTNTANGCNASDVTTVSSQFLAPAATASGGTLNCLATSLQLQATAEPLHTVFGWQGPNGFASNLLNPAVSVPGNYVLTVTDTLNTCVTQVTAAVVSNMTHPTVTASVSSAISCPTPTVTLTALSNPVNVNYAWTGPNNFSSNLPEPAVSLSGTYTVTATNPVNGCTGIAAVAVSGNSTPPVVTAGASGTITCTVPAIALSGAIQPAFGVNFNWTGPNGFVSTQLNPLVSIPGVYTLTATNILNSCTSSASAAVVRNITPPGISTTGGVKTCANPLVNLYASAGAPGATFAWTGPNGFSSTQQNPVVSQAGFYTAVATNPVNGCTSSGNANVTSNLTPPVLLTNSSSITCTNPLGKPTASSTIPGITFAWTGPSGFTATGPAPQVPYPGFYTVVATNPVNGCTSATSVEVTDNTTPPLAVASAPQTLNCFNTPVMLDGGGSSSGNNFSYLWTTFDGHLVSGIYGLLPRVDAVGTYTIKVTNVQSGCFTLDSVEVFQAPPVTAVINQVVHVTCNGAATGAATVKASGGKGTFTYGWSNGSTAATATGLSVGLYTVTVSDADGCSAAAQILINQPTVLQAILTVTHQTIFGINNGTANAVPSGGTSPYTFKWSNNATTANITSLAPGAYTVTVTDNKACTLLKTANVNAVNCTLAGSLATTNVTCPGAANGSATANTTGGSNPVNYLWSHGANTKTVSNLPPGAYKVTATDAVGCTVVLNTQITSPDPLSVAFVAKENVPCPNSTTGLLTAGAGGGTAPYSYTWSTGASGANLTGLGPGTYTVTATDAKGCTKNGNAQIVITDQNPPQLVLKNASVALGTNGLAAVTPALFDNGSFDPECSIATWAVTPTTFDCTQLGVRTVTLTATDVNGNSRTGTATVNVTDGIAPVLICPSNIATGACSPVVQFALPQVTDNCAVNPAQVQLKSGLPSGSGFPVGKTIEVFSYIDPAGNIGECSFEVRVDATPEASVAHTPASCSGLCDGTATVSFGGGDLPAAVLWSNGQSGLWISGLCPASYTVTVVDNHGCTQQLSVNIPNINQGSLSVLSNSQTASCVAACDGSIDLGLTGGAAPVQIEWSNGQTGNSINNLCAGTYTATVTDANGCSQEKQVQIDVVDQVAPTLNCPADVTTSFCTPIVVYAHPEILDNCPVDPQQLQQLAGLASGSTFPIGLTTQQFRYIDAAGNSGLCDFSVTVIAPPVLTGASTTVTCAGACNGQATLAVSGGMAPLTIKWNNGQTGSTATGLCAGTYTATVTDAAGCVQTLPIVVQQPNILTIDVAQQTDDTGNAGAGVIEIAVSGGTAPYSFAWTRDGQPFSTAQNLSGLFAGQYAVVVTDAKGCTISSAALTINNTVGAQEAAWAKGLRLQPNPAGAFTRLVLAEALGQEAEIRVLSASGAVVRTERLAPEETLLDLNLGDLPGGFWLVQVRTVDGATVTRKLVIER